MMLRTFGFSAFLLLIAVPVPGQIRLESSFDCEDVGNSDRETYCEIREETLAGGNPLDVDAGPNGGIRVRGWERGEILVRARVVGHADTEQEARQLVAGVRVDTGGGQVRAQGPERGGGDRHWAVSYEIMTPQNAQLTLNTRNGGISIRDLRGSVRFRARNGGIKLENVGGEMRGETTNGGLSIDLTGDRWDGSGLDVETQNGGVTLDLPSNYSAELETGTTNGRLNIDFPISVQGLVGRRLNTTLGAGGPKIRAMTHNGGVRIRRR
jgi:hypothetical protein